MRREFDPQTILCTSDFCGLSGFRVVVRQRPANGIYGTGSKGLSDFRIGYRPGPELGKTILRFRRNPENEIRMTKLASIVPPEEPFEASYIDAAGKVAMFEIHPDFLAGAIASSGIEPAPLRQVPPVCFITTRRVDWLCSLLMHETETRAQLGRTYFEWLAKALIIAVVSQTDTRLPAAGNLYVNHERIQRVVFYIESNFCSKLTIQQLARVSNLSQFHFSRLFTRLVGLTPHEYLLSCRLQFSIRLLRTHPEYPIADVALAAGFSDQSHFTRSFRYAFAKTPKAYRDESRNGRHA